MRLPLAHRRDSAQLDVKMTPMIDVIFLLLTFFICTTSFRAAEEALPTNLLAAGTGRVELPPDPELEELEEVVVRVLWEEQRPRWEINEQKLGALSDVRVVLAPLAQVQRNLPVVLRVAGEVPLGALIDVYDLCRQLGFERIQFAAGVKP